MAVWSGPAVLAVLEVAGETATEGGVPVDGHPQVVPTVRVVSGVDLLGVRPARVDLDAGRRPVIGQVSDHCPQRDLAGVGDGQPQHRVTPVAAQADGDLRGRCVAAGELTHKPVRTVYRNLVGGADPDRAAGVDPRRNSDAGDRPDPGDPTPVADHPRTT